MTAGATSRAMSVIAAVALSAGCGAGQRAQTYQERSSADASDAAVGALALRNVAVAAPTAEPAIYRAGGDARVGVTIVSEDAEPDRLVEVTSPAATSVVVLVDGRPGAAEVSALGSSANRVSLILVGLTRDLRPGQFVEMTFAFERNGSRTLLVPVAIANNPVPRDAHGAEEERGH